MTADPQTTTRDRWEDHGWSRVTYYKGGDLCELRFEGMSEVRLPPAQVRGGRRSHISGFSRASRRRLLRRMASVNRLVAPLPAFVTLTYPREWPEDHRVWKNHLRAFLKRLRRAYGRLPVVWRLEFQKRGAPHFHLLCFGLRLTPELRSWCSRVWYEIVQSGDEKHLRAGTNCEQPKSWRMVTAYLSKYIAKVDADDDEELPSCGRIWGIESRDQLPVEPLSFLIAVREGVQMRRMMRRHAGVRGYRTRKITGLTTFCPAHVAEKMLRHATREPVPTPVSGLPPPLAWAAPL